MSKNLKLKNVIKSFVPEPISCILEFPLYVSRIHILVVFLDPWFILHNAGVKSRKVQ